MKRDEVAALMKSGGKAFDPGPIETYLQAVASERDLPEFAIGMCVLLLEEAPALRAVLSKAADGEILSEDEGILAFRGLHILGGARDTGAWPILSRLLRRPNDEIDDLLGDTVTETLPRIAAGMFNGDVDDLFSLIADRSIDEYLRSSLLGAAAFLTWDGRIERERMREFLERFYVEGLAADGEFAWVGWFEAIALLGLRDLAPLFRNAWEGGRIDTEYMDQGDFETDLASAERAPTDIERFAPFKLGYIEDVVEALSWAHTIRDLDRVTDTNTTNPAWLPEEPYVNPWRHVGRNDPCPCGSGKKAKKCCLAG